MITRRRGDPPWRRRRRRLLRRALIALLAIAAVAAVWLIAAAILREPDSEQVAEQFTAAWAREDYAAMYAMLGPTSRSEVDEEEFAEAYQDAAATATVTALEPGDASESGEQVVVPMTVRTAVFGTLTGDLRLTVRAEGEEREVLDWGPELAFPGLAEDEELTRRTRAPRRGTLLARDGTVLAEGDAGKRSSELGLDASAVSGTIGAPASKQEAQELYARGFPDDAQVGLTGLERLFEEEVAGTPGGVLLAGDRELARTEPLRAEPIRTTIAPDVQEAAALALSTLGGVAAVDARTGEVRALTGLGATGPQPPGSTFKIVTTTAALEADLVMPSEEFPVQTAAIIDGVTLRNAHGEACGGSFTTSFARSCNSVFAPLGVEVGAERLIETAERYGINREPTIPAAEPSTMPEPDEIESDLELGATAIGQGRLLMTPLRLAVVSQTIANDGKLVEPTLEPGIRPDRRRVTTKKIANTIEELMVGVVTSGTGQSAAIAGIDVAGKTGTAEVGEDITEHAWFTGFAPAGRNPELAVAVMILNGGAGGEVAAPRAQDVLEAGL